MYYSSIEMLIKKLVLVYKDNSFAIIIQILVFFAIKSCLATGFIL